MPFDLTNILATVQDYINKIIIKKLDIFVIIYLDGIFIYIENERKYYVEAVR